MNTTSFNHPLLIEKLDTETLSCRSSFFNLAATYGGVILNMDDNSQPIVLSGTIQRVELDKVIAFFKVQNVDKKNSFIEFGLKIVERLYFFYLLQESHQFLIGIPAKFDLLDVNNLLPIGILQFDPHWCLTQSNKYIETILGINESDLLDRKWLNFFDMEEISSINNRLESDIDLINPPSFTQKIQTPLGRTLYLDVQVVKSFNPLTNQSAGFILIAKDITEQLQIESKIRHAATHDKLTGIPNRAFLNDRLSECVEAFLNYNTDWLCCYIDINRFKRLNDTNGHHFGDEILVKTAEKLLTLTNEHDFLCRNGGDEFLLLKRVDKQQSKSYSQLLQQIDEQLNTTPYGVEKGAKITSSIGAVKLSDVLSVDFLECGFKSIEDLWLALADSAMYCAKEQIGNHLVYYSLTQVKQTCKNFGIAMDLGANDINDYVTTYFQPIYDLNQNIVSLECLARFKKPFNRNKIEQVIRLSKQSGHERKLFTALLKSNINAINRIEAKLNRLNIKLNFQVNIEPFMIESFAATNALLEQLKSIGVEQHRIFVELSERDISMDLTELIQLDMVRKAGFKIAMDDFGVGTSNLKRLLEFNFDQIKLDKCFLDDADGHYKMFKSLAEMLRSLRLPILVEGIEFNEHVNVCRGVGVDLMQGFLLSRPANEAKILDVIQCNLKRKA
ncbi:signal transduction protein [Pseudoalteromonas luteoviolacea B = ATCC 29581]|nr:signal transduction protein [Pseudoalteromonas luteoviolacea B = ATCC 29581]